jgi:hypothetical protein
LPVELYSCTNAQSGELRKGWPGKFEMDLMMLNRCCHASLSDVFALHKRNHRSASHFQHF